MDNQEKKAGDYAKGKDWRIAEVRKDVASGKNADRDGYKDLLAAINAGRIDVVIVYRLDRKLIDEDQFRQRNTRLLERKQELQDELTGIDAELAGCEDAEVSLEAAKKALSHLIA